MKKAFILAGVFASLLTLSQGACAKIPIQGKDFDDSLSAPSPEKIKSISLFLIQPFTESVVSFSEEQVESSRCHYTTTDTRSISNFAKILKQAEIRKPRGKEVGGGEPRMVFFLELADHSKAKYAFGAHFPAETNIRGTVNDAEAIAQTPFVESIYQWTLAERSIRDCDTWLKRYSVFPWPSQPVEVNSIELQE